MLFDVFVSIPLRIFSVVYQLKISFLFLEKGILISVHLMSPMSSYAIKASSNQKMIKSSPELASSFCENEMWIWSRSGSCVIQRCNDPVSTPLFGFTVLKNAQKLVQTGFKLTCSLYFEPIAHEKEAVQVAIFLQLDFLDFSLLLQQKSVSHSFSILMKVEFEVDGQFE